ncbi:MAG: gamma-glutamylcyclotransferase family protein [Pseudomonadales bacterium]
MILTYFAYGSNMNPDRVAERGLLVQRAESARLPGYRLLFDKTSNQHPGVGHANVAWAPEAEVEGVLYWLAAPDEIVKMDRFERTPVNYSREVVQVHTAAGPVPSWTYFANPAVRRAGLKPPRSYLRHLLAGAAYVSPGYLAMLEAVACAEDA